MYMSVTLGVPAVTVPVLSSTTISVLPAASSEEAVLKSTPDFAVRPDPAMTATGVASPSAQGQLMTSTLTALAREYPASFAAIIHVIKVIRAINITAGTNIPETLSAVFAIGALVAAAFSTISIIRFIVVSVPTFIALHVM